MQVQFTAPWQVGERLNVPMYMDRQAPIMSAASGTGPRSFLQPLARPFQVHLPAQARTFAAPSLPDGRASTPAASFFMGSSPNPRQHRSRTATPPPSRPVSTAPVSKPALKPVNASNSWQAKADAFLSTLNSEQLQAATTQHHAVRVKAGPGSGGFWCLICDLHIQPGLLPVLYENGCVLRRQPRSC